MSTLKVDNIRHNNATSDAITMASDGTCTAKITGMTGGGGLSHRNKIINGAMTVSQRHGTTVVTGVNSSGYRIDRWTHQCASINSAFSVSQSTDSPDGFGNSYKIDVTTADTSLSAAHAHFFRQKIEGQNLQDFAKGTSSAKQFALSFYVKTNKTGVYTVELYDVDNNRAISKIFTVADTNWNRYTIIFPADTTGAFANDNGNSLVVQFFLSAGSNYTTGTFNNSAWGSVSGKARVSSSNVNFADSTSNNWYITGVQLEVGDTATSFEHRSYADEIKNCQRYYYLLYRRGSSSDGNICIGGLGSCYTATSIYIDLGFPTQMRTAPTLEVPSGSTKFQACVAAACQTFDNIGIVHSQKNCSGIYGTLSSSRTAGQVGNTMFQTSQWSEGDRCAFIAEL